MKKDEVKLLTPKERFTYWVNERNKITLKRQLNQSAPWTNDEILQTNHFTNVRREDDRVSRWLVENLYNQPHETFWATILVSRFVNNPKSLQLIVNDLKVGNFAIAKEKLKAYGDTGEPIFRSAYLQPEIKGVNRLDKIFDIFLPQILAIDIPTDSLEKAVEAICTIKYLGPFIGGQMAMDALIWVPGEWKDKNSWAPVGPGSLRGINRLKEVALTKKVNRSEYDEWLLHLSTELGVRALDIEHSLCEWDKYERILWHQGNYNRSFKSDLKQTALF